MRWGNGILGTLLVLGALGYFSQNNGYNSGYGGYGGWRGLFGISHNNNNNNNMAPNMYNNGQGQGGISNPFQLQGQGYGQPMYNQGQPAGSGSSWNPANWFSRQGGSGSFNLKQFTTGQPYFLLAQANGAQQPPANGYQCGPTLCKVVVASADGGMNAGNGQVQATGFILTQTGFNSSTGPKCVQSSYANAGNANGQYIHFTVTPTTWNGIPLVTGSNFNVQGVPFVILQTGSSSSGPTNNGFASSYGWVLAMNGNPQTRTAQFWLLSVSPTLTTDALANANNALARLTNNQYQLIPVNPTCNQAYSTWNSVTPSNGNYGSSYNSVMTGNGGRPNTVYPPIPNTVTSSTTVSAAVPTPPQGTTSWSQFGQNLANQATNQATGLANQGVSQLQSLIPPIRANANGVVPYAPNWQIGQQPSFYAPGKPNAATMSSVAAPGYNPMWQTSPPGTVFGQQQQAPSMWNTGSPYTPTCVASG